MAEKKVSGKNKNKQNKNSAKTRISAPPRDAAYDDFVAHYGSELRRRSTRTITEPVKDSENSSHSRKNSDIARCGEINPGTTINPATQRQILTKRTGRILADDTGFKTMYYNQRFELRPEMPEVRLDEAFTDDGSFSESGVPGQQTMSDLIASSDAKENISVPIEGKITEDNNPFKNAYREVKKDKPPVYGKSEKLRAIARTAADDTDMDNENQLVFPAFDPLFKFPETEEKSKKIKKDTKEKKHRKKAKEKKQEEENNAFDIDENDIVTGRDAEKSTASKSKPDTSVSAKEERKKRENKLFDFIKNNNRYEKTEPIAEINNKGDIKNAFKKLKKHRRITLIKSGLVLLLGVILLIISIAFDSSETGIMRSNPSSYSFLSLMFLIAASLISVKELASGAKDIARFRFSANSGGLMIMLSSLIQTILSLFVSDTFPGVYHLTSAAAIFAMLLLFIPKLILTNNFQMTINMIAGNSAVSVFRTTTDGGIESSVAKQLTGSDGSTRYFSKTRFITGITDVLTGAVPKPFAFGGTNVLVLIISAFVSTGAGILEKSAMAGFTVFSALMAAGLPLIYFISASFILFKANNNLAVNRSSLLSYNGAGGLNKTKAVIFNADEIVEQSSCSIHGVKPFGKTDPRRATLFCAAVMNGSGSPLSGIIKQVTDQSGEDVPIASSVEVFTGKGVKAIVEHCPVLLGTKSFLEENNVFVPDDDYDGNFITGDRKLLFLSVNGEFSMLLTVSYHIRRSMIAFLKYLSDRKIKIMICSSDPNVNADYISKKCKTSKNIVSVSGDAEFAYFRDKSEKTEAALPADVFADGKISSLSLLFRTADNLTSAMAKMPVIAYILSAVSILAVSIPSILGMAGIIGNIYIILIRFVCLVLTVLLSGTDKRKR